MMRVELTVPGEPLAQPRQRHRIIKRKGGGEFVHNYTPAKSPINDYKATIRLAFREKYDGAPSLKPIILQVTAVFERKKNMIWKTKPMPRVPHTKRPDGENVCKAIQDSLSGLAYKDDSQVHYLIVQKFIASGDEQPHTRIVISD